ncbi:MAG: GNAT family N-acetyltransferase [Paracoccaceae bacterium]|jgi:N-acetylglutamate synthase|nr:GNAT family N-acetyltransferase [Paracoccaceae bacterium]
MSFEANPLYDVIEATWPPAAALPYGNWTIREGQGGGKRVSAATENGLVESRDLVGAEREMQALGQTPLFMLRAGETDLDKLLDQAGYDIIDPVHLFQCPIATLATERPPKVSMFDLWEPLHIQYDIWQAGGIDPPRWAIMERVKGAKTSLLGRCNNRPAATGFVAVHDGIAMVHAIEVLADQRGQKVATWLMRAAAFWAADHGASQIAVLCRKANSAANGLYSSLGMQLSGFYHYRIQKEA